MSKLLSKIIRDAIASNSCKIGTREALGSINDAKIIVCSSSLPSDTKKKIEESARSRHIPIYNFDDGSVEMGRLCNKPFRISVLSITSGNESEISALLKEVNKEESRSS